MYPNFAAQYQYLKHQLDLIDLCTGYLIKNRKGFNL